MKESSKLTKIMKQMGMSRFVVFLMAGIVLLLLSVPGILGGSEKNTKKSSKDSGGLTATSEASNASNTEEYTALLETKLQNLLKSVDGVGENRVMITLSETGERVTLKDQTREENEFSKETDSQGGTREQNSQSAEEQTVILDQDGEQTPYVVKETQPEIAGVLVVAKGGGDTMVKKEIIEAVQVLFHMEAHKIKVMKMEFG